MQRRLRSFAVLLLASGLAGASIAACNGQGEGQRCSTTDDQGGTKSDNGGATYNSYAGSSDCSGDLWCYPAAELGGAASQYPSQNGTLGICCPPPGQRDSSDPVAICSLQVGAGSTGFDDAGHDGGSDGATGTDAGSGDAADSGTADSSTADSGTADSGTADSGTADSGAPPDGSADAAAE